MMVLVAGVALGRGPLRGEDQWLERPRDAPQHGAKSGRHDLGQPREGRQALLGVAVRRPKARRARCTAAAHLLAHWGAASTIRGTASRAQATVAITLKAAAARLLAAERFRHRELATEHGRGEAGGRVRCCGAATPHRSSVASVTGLVVSHLCRVAPGPRPLLLQLLAQFGPQRCVQLPVLLDRGQLGLTRAPPREVRCRFGGSERRGGQLHACVVHRRDAEVVLSGRP